MTGVRLETIDYRFVQIGNAHSLAVHSIKEDSSTQTDQDKTFGGNGIQSTEVDFVYFLGAVLTAGLTPPVSTARFNQPAHQKAALAHPSSESVSTINHQQGLRHVTTFVFRFSFSVARVSRIQYAKVQRKTVHLFKEVAVLLHAPELELALGIGPHGQHKPLRTLGQFQGHLPDVR